MAEPPQPHGGRPWPGLRFSPGLRYAAVSVAAVAVAGWGAVVLAVTGAFFTPYRIGSALVPVSLVLAAAGNAALIWFLYAVTRRRMLALLPGLVWLVVSFLGADRTTEGDLVLTQDNWVAAVYVIVGCLAIAAAGYRLFVAARPVPTGVETR